MLGDVLGEMCLNMEEKFKADVQDESKAVKKTVQNARRTLTV